MAAALPPADPAWEAHLTVAYEFEAPRVKNGNRYPRVHWMVRARRLWQDFPVEHRNDIARFIARAYIQDAALDLIMIPLQPDAEVDEDEALEEYCIAAIEALRRLISTYEEWRHASLHCADYPEESVHWLQSAISDCDAVLSTQLYPRYRDVRRALGAIERSDGPGPHTRVPGYLERFERVIAKAFVRRQRNAPNVKPHELVGEHWLGGWVLGHGGQGFVNLWIQVDDNHRITARSAVKDSYVTASDWNRLSFWHGDVRNIENRIPVDVQALLHLRDTAQCDKIVYIESWAPHWEHMVYRMYLSYHAYWDLEHLMHGYRDAEEFSDGFVPEPFVWRVFEACVQAGLAMESGAPGYDGVDWPSIVHRDLKPNNIFLDEMPSNDWLTYPTPKLGDFGLALFTDKDDPFNPDAYTGPGTKGYRAPEQTQLLDPDSLELVDPDERFLLTSKTNVWAVGKTIMEVMNLASGEIVKRYRQPKYIGRDREPQFTEMALWYSKELRRLVKACVRYEPNRRPTFKQLLQEIRYYTAYVDDNDADEYGLDDDASNDPDAMDWEYSSDSEDASATGDLADGMRNFDPSSSDDDPHPLLHFETLLGRSFPINGTIVAGAGGLPAPGMGWQLPGGDDGSSGLTDPPTDLVLPPGFPEPAALVASSSTT